MVVSKNPNYLKFWGKQRGAIEGGANWHTAAYHCLDVAASANALLEANDLLRRQLAGLLVISERQLIDLMTFWMALHVNAVTAAGAAVADTRCILAHVSRPRCSAKLPRADGALAIFWLWFLENGAGMPFSEGNYMNRLSHNP